MALYVASGGGVGSHGTQSAPQKAPLDFAGVTDHDQPAANRPVIPAVLLSLVFAG
jgi:hypothetical protein